QGLRVFSCRSGRAHRHHLELLPASAVGHPPPSHGYGRCVRAWHQQDLRNPHHPRVYRADRGAVVLPAGSGEMSRGESATPLGVVRGLGSAHHGGEHWLTERVTSLALLFLGTWFIASLLLLPKLDQRTLIEWL